MFALRLQARFLLASALLVLTAAIAGVWATAVLGDVSGALDAAVSRSDAVTAATTALSDALEREDDDVVRLLGPEADSTTPLQDDRERVDRTLDQLQTALVTPGEQAALAQLTRAIERYREAANAIEDAPLADRLEGYRDQVNPRLRSATAQIAELRSEHFRASQAQAALAADQAEQARARTIGVTLGALVIGVFVSFLLLRSVVTPLRALAQGVRALQAGDFTVRVRPDGDDELAELTRAFNSMADAIEGFNRANLDEILRVKTILERTIEALPDAVLLLSKDGRVLLSNEAAVPLGVQGTPGHLSDLALTEAARAALLGALQGGGTLPETLRDSYVHETSQRRFLPRLVRVPGAAVARAVLVLADVTRLAAFDEQRGEWIAIAAHELGTPLTTLRMTLHMLDEHGDTLSAAQRELVQTSLSGVNQLSELVDAYLDLTRLEADALQLERAAVQPAALIDAACAALLGTAENSAVRIRRDIAPDLPDLHGDPLRLRTVLTNLLGNAIKYTPQDSEVRVVARRIDNDLELSVHDAGPGVPEAWQERIFDRFFRVEDEQSTQGRRPRGHGVGLYLCREIIHRHGGQLRCATSELLGGACFVVRLPGSPGRA